MSASDQHQTPEVAWRRNPAVRRLAQCLTVGLLAAGGLWFSPLWLGRSGTQAFAACLAIVTILAVITFLAAVATRDISVALGSAFALALAAVYWFIAITFGMTDLVRLSSSMPVVSSKSPNHAMERTPKAFGVAHLILVRPRRSMKPPSIESGGAELPLGIAQRLLYGVILPNFCLLGLGALHWLILLPVSQGESKGWNLIILFYYIPIIAGISTLVSCWVLWRSAFSRSEQFVLGMRVPLCSYGVILVFTLYLYWQTSR